MNRALLFPAGLCLIAFAALFAVLQNARGRANADSSSKWPTETREADSGVPAARSDSQRGPQAPLQFLSDEEGHALLSALADRYMGPWRRWETSSHHLYSRAAPRPIPTISGEIILASLEKELNDGVLLGTIVIHVGAQAQQVPCTIDRVSKRVYLCAEGQWITADDWVQKAPTPW